MPLLSVCLACKCFMSWPAHTVSFHHFGLVLCIYFLIGTATIGRRLICALHIIWAYCLLTSGIHFRPSFRILYIKTFFWCALIPVWDWIGLKHAPNLRKAHINLFTYTIQCRRGIRPDFPHCCSSKYSANFSVTWSADVLVLWVSMIR